MSASFKLPQAPVKDLQGRLLMHDGKTIPQLGLGVYEMTDAEAERAVYDALDVGYRHVDSAEWYENEQACGKGINRFLKSHPDVTRDQIFFTTKLMTNRGHAQTLAKVQESLKLCNLEYIDLYLLHSPIGGPKVREQCWRACLDAREKGWVRSVGVSNWSERHIKELEDLGLELPVLNQIDVHPFTTRTKLVDYCQQRGIVVEAWAPLARAMRFDHPTLVKIAERVQRSPAQVMLRWSLQNGYIPIPKSVSRHRIVENASVFDFVLEESEMRELNGLDENLITDWDLATLD